jgi:hypothetical protein
MLYKYFFNTLYATRTFDSPATEAPRLASIFLKTRYNSGCLMIKNLSEAYSLLQIKPGATDEQIASAFKKMAMLYHPDRNRDNDQWANEKMSGINSAYNFIMSSRFTATEEPLTAKQPKPRRPEKPTDYFADKIVREQLIKSFVTVREETKEHIYRYYQYQLYNIARRDNIMNRSTFKDVVNRIKKSYHTVQSLSKSTKDEELLHHFSVFNKMIFNFYKSSECLNILDSYKNVLEVEAYNQYHIGDKYLHEAEIELFYNRHNRSKFFQAECVENAMNAKLIFIQTLKSFPKSSWGVETEINLFFTDALLAYVQLFFND